MAMQLDAAFNYNDLTGLETLKSGARHEDPKALKAVAQQFESMFISMIMKSMRDATDVMASDLESSYQTKFYRDMHDQQLSLSVSQNGGFGLADILYEQLAEAQNPTRQDLFSIDVKGMDQSNRPVLPLNSLDLNTQRLINKLNPLMQTIPNGIEQPVIEGDELSGLLNTPDASLAFAVTQKEGKGEVFKSPEEFIKKLLPLAEKAAKVLGLEPKFLVAQAALETGWGKFVIEDEAGDSSFNLFGIKADQRWEGKSAMTTTHEYMGGKKLMVKEPFRAYDSAEASFNDYVNFISNSERYQPAIDVAQNGDQYAQALQNAGYATDPNYAEKISRIANSDWFKQG